MQILEVKNDTAKIIYNPSQNHLLPADFILVEDNNQKLIAQVQSIETTEETNKNSAMLRLSLSIDLEDNLSYYNGYIPSKEANLVYINPDEIIDLIRGNDLSLYFGNLSNHQNCFAHTNISFLDDKTYILSDRLDAVKTLTQNLISELLSKKKKIIILDFNGQYKSFVNVSRLQYTKNIKLPLDIDAFDTLLEYDITDCPLEDKAVIQSIVLELREYMNTLDDKYIPFNMFKNVVDTEFISSPISGLMLLRNKLWAYAQNGIFADKKEQFDVIDEALNNTNLLIIDASDVEENWYEFVLKTVVELTKKDCYLFLSLNDLKISGKSFINLYNKTNIIPVCSSSYDSPYRTILNSLTKNYVLCKPSKLNNDNEPYSILINRMNNNEFILYGEATLYLPLAVELRLFDSNTREEIIQNDVKRDVDKLLSSPQSGLPKANNINNEINKSEKTQSDDLLQSVPDDTVNDGDYAFLDELAAEQPIADEQVQTVNEKEEYTVFKPQEEQKIVKDSSVEDIMDELFVPLQEDVDDIQLDETDEQAGTFTQIEKITEPVETVPNETTENSQNVETIEMSEKIENVAVDELPELNLTEDTSSIDELLPPSQDDAAMSVPENVQQEENMGIHVSENISEINNSEEEETDTVENEVSVDEENVDLSVSEDVTAESEESHEEQVNQPEPAEQTDDDNFDIEFEDDDEEPTPPPVKEIPQKKEEKIPVYETTNHQGFSENDIPFKLGDKVYHPKHGYGVIEGFANYSNKILFCQIDFDNVGRRILDPRISGIEKVS